MAITVGNSSGYSLQISIQSLVENQYPQLVHTDIMRADLRKHKIVQKIYKNNENINIMLNTLLIYSI